jgi:hypothetical protein
MNGVKLEQIKTQCRPSYCKRTTYRQKFVLVWVSIKLISDVSKSKS